VAASPLRHLCDGKLGHVKEPRDIDAKGHLVVGFGVLSEWLGEKEAGVVDERVNALEPPDGFSHHSLGCLPVCHVPGHDKDVGIARVPRGSRGRHNAVVALAIGRDQGRPCEAPVITATLLPVFIAGSAGVPAPARCTAASPQRCPQAGRSFG
jgi:hypothetical protein